jgi:hypothetical protein
MQNATCIIKDVLKDVGIEHQYNEKEKKVSFKVGDMCKVEIHKYPYGSGYGINTVCPMGNNTRLNSVADFVDTIRISKDNKKFELYATSSDNTLGAGKIDIIVPVQKVPKSSGKYEIDCTRGNGNDCNISRLYLKDIRDNEETLLDEDDKIDI